MKKFEIAAYSYKNAVEIAKQYGIQVTRNATRSYENRADGTSMEDFAADYFKKIGIANKPGTGCIIVVTKGVPDTRKNPCKLEKRKQKGTRTKQRMFDLMLASDNTVLRSVKTRKDAVALAKSFVAEYQEEVVCKCVYRVDPGQDVVFNMKYAPSVRAKVGRYIVLGVE